jgi:uncharacterized membrane protein
MEMTEVAASADYALIRQYLVKVSAGLKQISENQKREILAEIDSHLRERIEELRADNEPHPVERAISGLGDPAALASEFVSQARTKSGIHSYAPWTLFRNAARVARTGTKGLFIFLIGLFGYGFTVAGLVAAMMKPFIPQMGLWVGSWGFVWGVKPDAAPGHELLGRYFIQASIALSFVFGSTTTLVLRRIVNKIPFFGKWPME